MSARRSWEKRPSACILCNQHELFSPSLSQTRCRPFFRATNVFVINTGANTPKENKLLIWSGKWSQLMQEWFNFKLITRNKNWRSKRKTQTFNRFRDTVRSSGNLHVSQSHGNGVQLAVQFEMNFTNFSLLWKINKPSPYPVLFFTEHMNTSIGRRPARSFGAVVRPVVCPVSPITDTSSSKLAASVRLQKAILCFPRGYNMQSHEYHMKVIKKSLDRLI